MTVRLALFKGKGQIGNAFIRLWTNSQYSHCEMVVDGICYSASVMDGGVRSKKVGTGDNEISLSPDKWDIVEIPWISEDKIVDYFNKTDYQKYGWFSLFTSQLFNRNTPSKDSQFCSEWCASSMGIPNSSSFSPATLGSSAAYIANVLKEKFK